MTKRAEYLESRGWKLTRHGWTKLGWHFQVEHAVRVQNWSDRTCIPIHARDASTPAEVARIANIARGPLPNPGHDTDSPDSTPGCVEGVKR